jgi:hypothetical protein
MGINIYVGPRIGMNPESLWGLPNLEYWQIPTQTDSGIPVPIHNDELEAVAAELAWRPAVAAAVAAVGSSGSGSASIFGEKTPILCVTEKKQKKAIPILVRGSPNRFG